MQLEGNTALDLDNGKYKENKTYMWKISQDKNHTLCLKNSMLRQFTDHCNTGVYFSPHGDM